MRLPTTHRRFLCLTLATLGPLANANPLGIFLSEKIRENSEVIQAEQVLRGAESEMGLARSSFYPSLGTSWTGSKTSNRPTWGNLLSVNAQQTLFSGGAEYAGLKASSLNKERAEQALADVRDNVAAHYARRLSMLTLQKERLDVLRKIKRVQEGRMGELTRRVRLGQSREPDLLQAEVENSRLDRRLLEIQNLVDTHGHQLRALLFLNEQEFSRISSLLNVQAVDLLLAGFTPRPEYRVGALKLQAEAQAQLESVSRLSYLPTIDLYGQRNLARPSSATNEWEWGLRAQWTFFEGFRSPARVAAAEAQKIIAERELFSAEFERGLALEQLGREIERLATRKDGVVADIRRVEKAIRQQERDYRLGLVTELEVQQTLQSMLDLDLELIDITETKHALMLQRFTGGTLAP